MDLNDSHDVVFWTLNGYGPTSTDLVIAAFSSLIALAIIFLNSIVLDTLRKNKHVLHAADIFIASIALADLLHGVTLLYHVTYNIVNFQDLTECRFRYGLIHTTGTSSVLNLVSLTFDRYVKITLPFKYNNIFHKTSNLCLTAGIWILSGIIGQLPIMGWNVDPPNDVTWPCTYFGVHSDSYLTLLVVLFLFTFFIMVVVYLHIFKVVWSHASTMKTQRHVGRSSKFARNTWRLTKTILIIAGVYFLTWIPTGITLMLEIDGRLGDMSPLQRANILFYVSGIAYINGIVNPIIYAFKIRVVKIKFYKMFCCKDIIISANGSVRKKAMRSMATSEVGISRSGSQSGINFDTCNISLSPDIDFARSCDDNTSIGSGRSSEMGFSRSDTQRGINCNTISPSSDTVFTDANEEKTATCAMSSKTSDVGISCPGSQPGINVDNISSPLPDIVFTEACKDKTYIISRTISGKRSSSSDSQTGINCNTISPSSDTEASNEKTSMSSMTSDIVIVHSDSQPQINLDDISQSPDIVFTGACVAKTSISSGRISERGISRSDGQSAKNVDTILPSSDIVFTENSEDITYVSSSRKSAMTIMRCDSQPGIKFDTSNQFVISCAANSDSITRANGSDGDVSDVQRWRFDSCFVINKIDLVDNTCAKDDIDLCGNSRFYRNGSQILMAEPPTTGTSSASSDATCTATEDGANVLAVLIQSDRHEVYVENQPACGHGSPRAVIQGLNDGLVDSISGGFEHDVTEYDIPTTERNETLSKTNQFKSSLKKSKSEISKSVTPKIPDRTRHMSVISVWSS